MNALMFFAPTVVAAFVIYFTYKAIVMSLLRKEIYNETLFQWILFFVVSAGCVVTGLIYVVLFDF